MPSEVMPYYQWLCYGFGHVLNDLCASMWFTYLLIFFLYVLKFDAVLAGVALLIGQVADGISTSVVGICSDRNSGVNLCHYGRRKSWHLLGTVCVLISFSFIFSPCYIGKEINHSAQLLYYIVFIIIFQFGWACVQISHLSLASELSFQQHERTSLLALRYTFTVFSNIIIYLVTWLVFHSLHDKKDVFIGPKDDYKFRMISFFAIGLGGITSIIFHVGVEEKIDLNDEQLIPSGQNQSSVIHLKPLYIVACIYVSTRLFVNLGQIYIPLYLQSYLHLPSENLAILPLVMYTSSFITSIIIKPLNVYFGRKVAFIYGIVMGLGACLWIGVGRDYYYRHYEIYGVVIAFGCASSIMLVTSLGITADLIGNNVNNGAFIYGIMSFMDKIANGVAVMLIQSLQCKNDCSIYYRDILLISCAGAAVCGLLSILILQPNVTPNVATQRVSVAVQATETSHQPTITKEVTVPVVSPVVDIPSRSRYFKDFLGDRHVD